MDIYKQLRTHADLLGERNDCGVIALAIAADIQYDEAHRLLKSYGRKDRRGTPMSCTLAALSELSLAVEQYKLFVDAKGSKYTPDRFARAFKYGTYFCRTYSHIFIVRNGKVLDWTAGRKHRIIDVIKLIS